MEELERNGKQSHPSATYVPMASGGFVAMPDSRAQGAGDGQAASPRIAPTARQTGGVNRSGAQRMAGPGTSDPHWSGRSAMGGGVSDEEKHWSPPPAQARRAMPRQASRSASAAGQSEASGARSSMHRGTVPAAAKGQGPARPSAQGGLGGSVSRPSAQGGSGGSVSRSSAQGGLGGSVSRSSAPDGRGGAAPRSSAQPEQGIPASRPLAQSERGATASRPSPQSGKKLSDTQTFRPQRRSGQQTATFQAQSPSKGTRAGGGRGADPARRTPPPKGGTAPQVGFRNARESGDAGRYRAPEFSGQPREYLPKQDLRKGSGGGMRSLKEQSPTRRRERSKLNRRGNPEHLRRANFRQQFRVVSRKKRPGSFYLKMACGVLALYLFFGGILGGILAANLLEGERQSRESIDYRVGIKNEPGYINTDLRYGSVFRGGVMMIDMSHVARLCDLTTVGDLTRMRYYDREGDAEYDEVIFYAGSATATVNGTPVILEGKTVFDGDHVYVSADFFSRFVTGVTVDYNEEKRDLTIARIIVATSLLKGNIYAPITFGLTRDEAPEPIDWDAFVSEMEQEQPPTLPMEPEEPEDPVIPEVPEVPVP